MNHLIALTDRTVKSSEEQKFRGYIKVWKNAKVLLGCAIFAEILKPESSVKCLYEIIKSVMKTKATLF